MNQISTKIEHINHIISQNQDLFGDIDLLRKNSGLHSIKSIQETIQQLQDQEKMLQVGVVGRVKAGKSSLLNALFFNGESILPKAATPMTAALTSLNYGEKISVRAEYFTLDEMKEFEKGFNEHEEAIALKVKDYERERATRQRTNASNTKQEGMENKLRLKAQRDLGEANPNRHAQWEQWQEIEKVGGSNAFNTAEEIRYFSSITELQHYLPEHVGANGKKMPFTKCLHLEIPVDGLKGVKVVDTPGTNDPVLSREQRTQSMLKDCDVVFVVSPAGQFLNQQDGELVERLNKSEGVRYIYIVASQFDTQLFGGECEAYGHNLANVINVQKEALGNHAKKTLVKWSEYLPDLTQCVESADSLHISSTPAYVVLNLDEKIYDETTKHFVQRLKNSYPNFTDSHQLQHWCGELSGIDQLKNTLDKITCSKVKILEERITAYRQGQDQAYREFIKNLKKHVEECQDTFEKSDLDSCQKEFHQLERMTEKKHSVNRVFHDKINNIQTFLKQRLVAEIEKHFHSIINEQENSSNRKTVTATRKKDSSWGKFQNFLNDDWGYEDYEKEVLVIKTAQIRHELDKFRESLTNGIRPIVNELNQLWREDLVKQLIRNELKEVTEQQLIKEEDIRNTIHSVLLGITDIPAPVLPPLPKELLQIGELEQYQAENFIKATEKYLHELKEYGNYFKTEIDQKMEYAKKYPVGEQVFKHLLEKSNNLKELLKNKNGTNERFKRLRNDLERISV